ncbi:MAG: hypothetical protein IIZ39_11025, partial [Blautia sp.]|nr:hypothetical protein [Blautia sp.]
YPHAEHQMGHVIVCRKHYRPLRYLYFYADTDLPLHSSKIGKPYIVTNFKKALLYADNMQDSIEKQKENWTELSCKKCGRKSLIYTRSYLSAAGCPVCAAQKDHEQWLEERINQVTNGEYTLQSSFANISYAWAINRKQNKKAKMVKKILYS